MSKEIIHQFSPNIFLIKNCTKSNSFHKDELMYNLSFALFFEINKHSHLVLAFKCYVELDSPSDPLTWKERLEWVIFHLTTSIERASHSEIEIALLYAKQLLTVLE